MAILVGNPDGEPSPVDDIDLSPVTGRLAYTQQTPGLALVPRCLWTGRRIEQLSPISAQVDYYFDI